MFQELAMCITRESFAQRWTDPDYRRVARSWYDFTSADAWLGERVYEVAKHLGRPGERWVTIGDGRFGLDSIRLRFHGAYDVLATDIDETLLRIARTEGCLSDYRVEDAEHLSFADQSFDYAFCKETLCECPRPAIALYEMLRIAKKGIILIERNDRIQSPLRIGGQICKRLLGDKTGCSEGKAYDQPGPYTSSLSYREIEKVALGLGLPQLAFRLLNEAYEPGLEFEKVNSARGRRMRRTVVLRDMLCHLRLDKATFLMAALFRVAVTQSVRSDMQKAGWKFTDLPRIIF